MIVVGIVTPAMLKASRGSYEVIIEHGATCSSCGGEIGAKQHAVYAWDNKRVAQPSRLHVEGTGTTEIRHKVCPTTPAPVHKGYQETSREAYEAARPKLTATEAVILDLYRAHGPMTDEEMYERYGALEPAAYRNTVLPARTGLAKLGLVYDTEKRRKVKSGRSAIVWGITSRAAAEAAEREGDGREDHPHPA